MHKLVVACRAPNLLQPRAYTAMSFKPGDMVEYASLSAGDGLHQRMAVLREDGHVQLRMPYEQQVPCAFCKGR